MKTVHTTEWGIRVLLGNTLFYSRVASDGMITKLTSWWQALYLTQAHPCGWDLTLGQVNMGHPSGSSGGAVSCCSSLYPAAKEGVWNVGSTRMRRQAWKKAAHQHDSVLLGTIPTQRAESKYPDVTSCQMWLTEERGSCPLNHLSSLPHQSDLRVFCKSINQQNKWRLHLSPIPPLSSLSLC